MSTLPISTIYNIVMWNFAQDNILTDKQSEQLLLRRLDQGGFEFSRDFFGKSYIATFVEQSEIFQF